MWVGFAAYLGALTLAQRLDRRLVWATIFALVVLFACLPPLLSHDVYSYVDYARLGVRHGLDPYVHAPDSAPADPAFPHVTWTETTSAYGPLFTLATYPLAWLPVAVAVYVLKAASATAVLAIAYLVARLAPARGIEPSRAAVFVALNPLVLLHVVGGPHNDGLAVLLMTLGIAGTLSAREGLSAVALVSAAATKATAAIAIPFALLGSTRRPRFLLGGLATLVLLALAAHLCFGWNWLHAFALATAWLLPWYLLWPLPGAALSRDRVLQFLILGLTAYQLGARIPL
jgi:alpha-1,6-mannosyltransferase